jgi:hypothetical protein
VQLKDGLGQIYPECGNLHRGWLLSSVGFLTAPTWHIAMPPGEPSTPSSRVS